MDADYDIELVYPTSKATGAKTWCAKPTLQISTDLDTEDAEQIDTAADGIC